MLVKTTKFKYLGSLIKSNENIYEDIMQKIQIVYLNVGVVW